MAEWKEIKEKALKILGDDAKVPDLPAVVNKASADVVKKYGEFETSRDDIKAKLVAVQNGNAAVRNAVKQFQAKIEKSDFNIDSKNKENVKKIEKAREILRAQSDHRDQGL